MTPESTSQAGSQTARVIQVPAPTAGTTTTVTMEPGSELKFGFNPGDASMSRSGNNLVFESDGGSVVITDFFVVGEEGGKLPMLRMPEGDLVPTEVAFAETGLDLSTAAGPGAGSPLSGGTNYDDDPGNLLAGINRLGSLGTDYWGRGTEPDIEQIGMLELPTGDFTFTVGANLGDGLGTVLRAYEDGRPEQHRGGDADTLQASRIDIDFNPGAGTSVGDVTLSGLPAGTQIYLGDPASGGTLVSDAGGSLTFSAGDFTGQGVYLIPPHNSDDDFTFNLSVDFIRGGQSITVSEPVTVIVDAVADRPDMEGADVADMARHEGSIEIGEGAAGAKQDFGDGWATDHLTKSATSGNTTPGGVTYTVPVEAEVQFYDFLDNSESHYLLIGVPDAQSGFWSCTDITINGVALPDNATVTMVTLWFDADGNVVEADDPAAVQPGQSFFQVQVPNDMIPPSGEVSVDANLVATDTNYVQDQTFPITIGAKAEESPSDSELRTDNNVSYNFGDDGTGKPPVYDVKVDTIDSGLTLKVGWASEDDRPGKHTEDGTYPGRDFGGMDDKVGSDELGAIKGVENVSTTANGAPVSLDIGSAGTKETITEASFTLKGGQLLSDGNPIGDGDVIGGYKVSISGDTVTFTLEDRSASPVTNLDGLKLTAVSTTDFGHNDLELSYSVKVESPTEAGGTGASAEFSGNSTVVVDAVADRATDFTAKLAFADNDNDPNTPTTNTEAAPGETVDITGTIKFPDMSAEGAEHHYIVLNVGQAAANGWTLPGGALVDVDAVYGIFKNEGGSQIPTAGLLTAPGYNDGNEYLVLEVVSNGAGGYKLVDANGADVTGVTLAGPDGNGVFTYTVTATAPDTNVDVESDVWATSVVVVENPNPGDQPGVEYDYANNIARGDTSAALPLNVDVVTSGLQITFQIKEDNEPDQNVIGEKGTGWANDLYGLPITIELVEIYPEGHAREGQIVVESGAAKPATDPDLVTSMIFNEVPVASGENAQGTIYYNGVAVNKGNVFSYEPDPGNPGFGTLTLPDGTTQSASDNWYENFTFRPVDDFSGDVTFDVTTEISSSTSNATASGSPQELHADGTSGPAHLHVDSVADLADGEIHEASREHDNPDTPQVELRDNSKATAGDEKFEGTDTYAKGWYTTDHGAEQTYTVTAKLDVTFTDLDKSETGAILIKVPAGINAENGDMVIYFDGSDTPASIVTIDGEQYWELAGGVVGDDLANLNGAEIRVEVKTSAKDNASLQLVVKTEEGADPDAISHVNETGNDSATFTGDPVGIKLPTLESTLKVEVGWAYEDGDAGKFGGTAKGPDANHDDIIGANDFDGAALENANGVPIKVSMSNANGEVFDGLNSANVIEFTYDASTGSLCWEGTPILSNHPGSGMVTVKVAADQLDSLTFKPNYSDGFSDEDIRLDYTVRVTDSTENTQFEIKGATYVVMDAVADKADVRAVSAKADLDADDQSVLISVKAAFPDSGDGSEGHYILVEAGRGWVVEGAETITVFRDSNGNILAPLVKSVTDNGDGTSTVEYDYATAPEGADLAKTETFYKVEATDDMKNGDGEYVVAVKPVDLDNMADTEDLKVGTLASEETLSGHEYDHSNNNAFSFGETDINVIDGGLHGKGAAYEDRSPEAHKGQGVDSSVNYITVEIGADTGGGVANTGEYLDLSQAETGESRSITIEFSFEGTDAEIAALLASGSFTLGNNASSAIQDLGGGRFSATIELEGSGLSGKLDEVNIRYNPPLDQDNDLTEVRISMPVTNDTGYKADLTTGEFDVVVDAVADLPKDADGSVKTVDGNDPADWKASWGDTIAVEVSAKFSDTGDGSESHYLMVEARDGWTCSTPGVITITLYYDGDTLTYPDPVTGAYPAGPGYTAKEFFALEVSGSDASETFELTAPVKTDTVDDVKTIAGDGTVDFITGGLAVEGTLDSNGAIDVTHRGDHSGGDSRYDNNIAFAQDTVGVEFNVINSVGGGANDAFEDHAGNKHYAAGDQYTGTTIDVAGKDGVITLTLNDPDGADVITGNVTLTFTIDVPAGWIPADGAPSTLGTFTQTDGTPITDVTFAAGPNGTAIVTVKVPDAAIDNHTGAGDNAAPEVKVQYTPPAFGNTDLKDLGCSMDVNATNSNDSGTVSNSDLGDLVVDAVADRPVAQNIVKDDIEYGKKLDGSNEDATAAIPGGKVTVEVTVTFKDIEEGGEKHYIAVKNSGWVSGSCKSADGLTDVSTATNPSNGAQYTMICVDDVIKTAIAEANGATSYTYNGPNGLTIVLETVDGHYTAKVTTEVEVRVPGNAASGSKTLEVCGVAVDQDTDDFISTVNDQAWDRVTTPIQVQAIDTTNPKLTMVDGQIFENLTPNAHLTQEQLAWRGPNGERHPDYVDAADGQGALMNFSGLHAGETAEITLTFSLETGGKLPDAPDDMAQMRVGYEMDDGNGGTTTVWVNATEIMAGDPPQGTGVWTVTLPDAANGNIIYEPGHNYNSDDIKVDYVIKVTDDATGQSKTWGTADSGVDVPKQPGLEIEVDAVAQFVEIEDVLAYGKEDGSGGFFPEAERGEPVFLTANLDLGDLRDGSQGAYLLLEATDAMMTPISVTIWSEDGLTSITLTYPTDWANGTVNADPVGTADAPGQYYKVYIPDDILKQLDTNGDGHADVKVQFKLDSTDVPSDMDSAHIRIGAGTYEKSDVVWEPANEWEATLDNNSSLVVSEVGSVLFGDKPAFSMGKEIWVSENDTSRANLDDPNQAGIQPNETPDGGAIIGLNAGADCEFTLEFTSVPSGTLYYMPAGDYGDVSKYDQYKLENNTSGNPALESKPGYVLVYVPDGDNYSDTDLSLGYKGTVTNTQTGQTDGFGGSLPVFVDAVAQMPTKADADVDSITLDHTTNVSDGTVYVSKTFNVEVGFPDDADVSENHYALVQVMPNMTVEGSVGIFVAPNGEQYYMIPVPQGQTSVEVTIQWTSRRMELGHNTDTIKIGALAEETVLDGAGTREQDYDNNMAYRIDGEISVTHNWQPGHVIWIDPAYENDTPVAHQDDSGQPGLQPDETPAGGAQIHIGTIDGTETVDSVSFTIPKDADGNPAGSIWVNGVQLTPTGEDANGVTYTYTAGQAGTDDLTGFGGLTFMPDKNYSDEDVNVGYTFTGKDGNVASGTFPVIVDAVAQLPTDPDARIGETGYGVDDTDPSSVIKHTAVGDEDGHGNEGLVTFTVSGEFEDFDQSEGHFALLEKKPGYTIVDEDGNPITYETVYLEGPDGEVHAYYKVPMENGKSVDVTVRVDQDFFNENNQFPIQTGVMNQEKNTGVAGNLESDISNNVSWNLEEGKTVVIEYSPVETTIKLAVDNTGERDMEVKDQHGDIAITVELGDYDKLESLELTFDSSKGKVVWKGGEDATGELDVLALLKAAGVTLTDGQDIQDALDALGLRFVSEGYGDTDAVLDIKASVSDTRSGDLKTDYESPATVVIDAIGHAPKIEKAGTGGTEDGSTAAKSGETLYAEVILSFDDVGSGEQHYAMMGQHQEWPCAGVEYFVPNPNHPDGGTWVKGELITFFDKAGKPYYALKVEDGMLDSDGDVQVRFELDAPAKATDDSTTVKIGGISLDPNMGVPGDGELDLGNNWDEEFTTIDLSVGVVETTGVTMNITGAVEDEPAQITFTLTGDHEDSIQSVIIKTLPAGAKILDADDNVLYEGPLTNIELNGAMAESGGYYYQAPGHKDGSMSLDYSVVVADDNSGAIKEFNNQNTQFTVKGEADKPLGLSTENVDHNGSAVGNPDAAAPGGQVSFDVKATFPDHDGSEQHYILVEAKAGWTCGNLVAVDGYFRIPVTSGYDADGNVTVTITMGVPSGLNSDDPVTLNVGAMSQEKAATADRTPAYADTMTEVTIEIGAVQSGAGDITIGASPTVEDPQQEGQLGSQLTFNLENAVANNETITGIKVTNLNGGRIWDSQTNDWVSGSQPVLNAADAAAGRYYYVPGENKSGDISVGFSVTVKDNASGATKNIPDSVTVSVTPVTDAPDVQDPSSSQVQVQAQHSATVTVTLSADFHDYTGTEEHFFLVKFPEGVDTTGFERADPALAAAAGMSGDVYYVKASGSTAGLNLTLDKTFSSQNGAGDIEYKAGSYESDGQDGLYPGARYEFSPAGNQASAEHTINAEGSEFNKPPTLSAPGTAIDVLRDADGKVEGTITTNDVDGDTVNITGLKVQGANDFATVENGEIRVDGTYGYLIIDVATKGYTYTLFDGVNPDNGAKETFVIQGTDNYGSPMSGETTLVVTLNNLNRAPTASLQTNQSGGVNEEDLTAATGTFVTRDLDNDAVTITGISLNGQISTATWNGSAWELAGTYGTLVIGTDGSYSYYRTDEFATGKDNFTIHFEDTQGAIGSGTLEIDAQAVNHAPVAKDTHKFYNDGSSDGISGKLAFSDPDAGDTAAILSVTYNGRTYDLASQPHDGKFAIIEGDDFTLKIAADGTYLFSSQNADTGDSHSFIYTVSDGSLDATGELFFGKGAASDFTFDGTKFFGTENADVLHGSADGNDTLYGFGGDDAIHTHGGNNVVYGGAGNDTILGGGGNDTIHGGAGNDSISGGAGNDVIYGGSGNDTLDGGAGDDVIHAGTGNNLIIGGAGNDIMYSGDGQDTFFWDRSHFGDSDAKDVIHDFNYSGGSGGDMLAFKDILGSGEALDSFLKGEGEGNSMGFTGGNKLTLEGSNCSITATFADDKSLTLEVDCGSGTQQTVVIHSNDAFYQDTLDQDAAALILQNIIKDGNF